MEAGIRAKRSQPTSGLGFYVELTRKSRDWGDNQPGGRRGPCRAGRGLRSPSAQASGRRSQLPWLAPPSVCLEELTFGKGTSESGPRTPSPPSLPTCGSAATGTRRVPAPGTEHMRCAPQQDLGGTRAPLGVFEVSAQSGHHAVPRAGADLEDQAPPQSLLFKEASPAVRGS